MTLNASPNATSMVDGPQGPVGGQMYDLIARLYPICRSLTGAGVRETLAIIGEHLAIEVREVPSGTQVFDWKTPYEWNLRDAYVANAKGERVIDVRQHNLHLVQYSVPVRTRMSLDELRPRLHTIPERPDAVPFRTGYFKESWGFCLSQRQLDSLEPGEYDVVIDTTIEPGSLTYGELLIPGERQEEVLFHTHISNPSLANDNLSAIAVAVFLAKYLGAVSNRLSYRFVFLPGLVGPITWLALNEAGVSRIEHGLVLAGVGDAGPFTYKRSRRGDAVIDRAMTHLMKFSGQGAQVVDFDPFGYDERHYCSPGFNLPVGCLMRTPQGAYPEYHTSDDNLGFVHPERLEGTLTLLRDLVNMIESDRTCRNLTPKGEPQLGARGLSLSGGSGPIDQRYMALLWVLNLSDGSHSLFDIAERSGLPFDLVERSATELKRARLLEDLHYTS